MTGLAFHVNITTPDGLQVGPGPIYTATRWENTARMDRAGEGSATFYATDPRTADLIAKRRLQCKALRNGLLTDFGTIIMDSPAYAVNGNDPPTMQASGPDLLGELADRTVGDLLLSDGNGNATAHGYEMIMAYVPSGWSRDTLHGHTRTINKVYYQFKGESVLAALSKLAELTGEHFRLGSGRQVVWMRKDIRISGVRAVLGGDPPAMQANTGICLIQRLTATPDSQNLITRIYPRGASDLTISAATWRPPTGYTINPSAGYIEVTDSPYGRIDRQVPFADVTALGNDTVAIANTLAQLGYQQLRKLSTLVTTYDLTVTKLDVDLLPGDQFDIAYRRTVNGYKAVDIDTRRDGQTLWVLENGVTFDTAGIRTNNIKVATLDRWPSSDVGTIVNSLQRVRILESRAASNSGLTAAETDAIISGAISGSTGKYLSQVPGGTIDGANTAFTLTYTPVSGSENIYLDGRRLTVSNDYTISGLTITLIVAPIVGDTLFATYLKA